MARSAIYFPLRSNAASLVAGQGVAGVRRRLMLSALLHDTLMIEEGTWLAMAGPDGGYSMWLPSDSEVSTWQTPRQRGKSMAGNFYVAVGPPNAPSGGPMRRMIDSPTAVSWRATFEPFKREVPRGAGHWDWLQWGHVEDVPAVKKQADAWYRTDQADSILTRRWPNTFIRNTYVKSTHLDLAIGAGLQVGVSTDGPHVAVVQARLRAGGGQLVMGHHALQLLVPVDLSWADVANLRKQKALVDYRAVVRDVEAAALDQSTSLSELDRVIRQVYWERVAAAEARRPPRWSRLAIAGVGFLVGEGLGSATVGVPGIGGAAGVIAAEVGGLVAEEALEGAARPKWLAVHAALKRPRPGGGS